MAPSEIFRHNCLKFERIKTKGEKECRSSPADHVVNVAKQGRRVTPQKKWGAVVFTAAPHPRVVCTRAAVCRGCLTAGRS